MDRAEAIYRAADAVHRHWGDDDAVREAAHKDLDDRLDLRQVELFLNAIMFLRSEFGEEPVQRLRAKYGRESAWARRRQTVRKAWREFNDSSYWP
jgi:hypothetical protein